MFKLILDGHARKKFSDEFYRRQCFGDKPVALPTMLQQLAPETKCFWNDLWDFCIQFPDEESKTKFIMEYL